MIGFKVADVDREANFFVKVLQFEEVSDFRVVGSEYDRDYQESCVEGHTLAHEGAGGTCNDPRRDHRWAAVWPGSAGVFAKDGLLDALKKALAERVLNAELDHHLAEERAQAGPETSRNHRNATAARRCWAARASWRSRCGATGRRASNRNSLPNTAAASPTSTTRWSRSTPAAWACGRSRATYGISMA
jgi:hypothetical protein